MGRNHSTNDFDNLAISVLIAELLFNTRQIVANQIAQNCKSDGEAQIKIKQIPLEQIINGLK